VKKLEDKIDKPKEFTDAEAEAFTRYLTKTRKQKKKLIEAILETEYGKQRFLDFIKKWGYKK